MMKEIKLHVPWTNFSFYHVRFSWNLEIPLILSPWSAPSKWITMKNCCIFSHMLSSVEDTFYCVHKHSHYSHKFAKNVQGSSSLSWRLSQESCDLFWWKTGRGFSTPVPSCLGCWHTFSTAYGFITFLFIYLLGISEADGGQSPKGSQPQKWVSTTNTFWCYCKTEEVATYSWLLTPHFRNYFHSSIALESPLSISQASFKPIIPVFFQ